MRKSVFDLAKLLLPTGLKKRQLLALAEPYLKKSEMDDIRHFLKMDKLFGIVHDYGTTPEVLARHEWVEFKSHVGDEPLQQLIAHVNRKIKEAVDERVYTLFAQHAHEKIPKLIANNIAGLEDEKFAAALLLFAREPFHILLLGDPGTGKTEILRSVAALSPKSSFGLGSGTTGAGLSATYKGDQLILGLLPQADHGVACIDELNLMKTQDRAALYSAMEKGFITYDKGGKSNIINARVRVFATANPKGDKFVGKSAEVLRKQLPFAQALLSRFHLVFLLRRPDAHELGQIARQIVKQERQQLHQGDVDFVKGYVEWSWNQNVTFDKKFEPMVVDFIEDLSLNEQKFLVEIGPRTVVGVIRMAVAYARMRGHDMVGQDELIRILRLVKNTLYVRKE